MVFSLASKERRTVLNSGHGIEPWQLSYVIDRQERAFQSAQMLAVDLSRNMYDNLPDHLNCILDAMSAQAETISALSGGISVLEEQAIETLLVDRSYMRRAAG